MSGCCTRASTIARRFLLQPPDNLGGLCFQVFEAGATERSLGEARAALGAGDTRPIKGAFDHSPHRGSRFKTRVLLDTSETSSFAERHLSAVGRDLSRQNS